RAGDVLHQGRERQCARVQGIRRRKPDLREMTSTRIAQLEGAVSLALLIGALLFQYVGHFPPCEMCHWQRWPHIASAVIGLGGGLLLAGGVLPPRFAPAGAALAVQAGSVSGELGGDSSRVARQCLPAPTPGTR